MNREIHSSKKSHIACVANPEANAAIGDMADAGNPLPRDGYDINVTTFLCSDR